MEDGIRLVMLEDAEEVVDALKSKNKISESKPKSCHKCKSDEILGIEVMGAYDGVLFWECHHPKFLLVCFLFWRKRILTEDME